MDNVNGLFDNVNSSVAGIAGQVGATPQGWNSGVYGMIRTLSDNVIFLKPENYLKNAEMAMEDDYGMIDGVINNGPKQTVAELEEQAKSGKPVSLMELAQAARREQAQAARQEKKPSVLAKLCPPVNEPKKTARSKRAERELL